MYQYNHKNSTTDPPSGSTFSAWTLGRMEHVRWKTLLNSTTPERLAQHRAYDKEKEKKYNQEHHEEISKRSQERYQQTKRACAKNMCVTIAGAGSPWATESNIAEVQSISLHCKIFKPAHKPKVNPLHGEPSSTTISQWTSITMTPRPEGNGQG